MATHLSSRDSATFDIDADGFFEGAPLWNGDVHPGNGVKFVAWDETHWHVHGRAEADATKATVWRMLPGTGLVPETIEFVKTSETRRKSALDALRLRLPVPLPDDDDRVLIAFESAIAGTPRPATAPRAPDPVQPSDGAASPRDPVAGLDLAAWVPARFGVFARFRSVEAAYRVLDEFDRCSGAALALRGDARDYGTLRLVLHDLLLPTIWRTNPESERGVGEVAVFVEAPPRRGRMEAAVVLRVTDPELHAMQTEAGIADEARPEHLWKPADDPFPDERPRRNFRRRVADVEVVATNESLLREIAERRFHPLDEDTQYATFRWGASDGAHVPPPTDEAAFVYCPAAFDGVDPLRPTPREFPFIKREAAGLDWLLRRWIGEGATAVDIAPGPAETWVAVTPDPGCVRATTDAKGMSVSVRYAFAERAQDPWPVLCAALKEPDRASLQVRDACLRNLEDLVPLALVENPQDDVAERNFVVLGWKPVCPCGGTYSVHPITREVSCSVHGTEKAPKTAPWSPPPISDVKLSGTELSFRLAIDWNRQR